MAAPAYQAGSGVTASDTTITKAWPTHIADDVAILIVQSSAQNITLSDAQGFVEFGTQQTIGTAGAAGAARIATFWCRATSSSMPSPTVQDAGNHITVSMITFRGCVTAGTPVTAMGGTTGSTSAISIPGGTTTTADCLIVACFADGYDNASTSRVSGWADSALASITERLDNGTTSFNGGGIGLAHGTLATAGAFGPVTATHSQGTVNWAGVTFALASLSPVLGADASFSFGAMTISGAAGIPVQADGAFTFGSLTVAGTSGVPAQAAGAFTFGAMAVVATGAIPVQASGAITFGAMTMTSTATPEAEDELFPEVEVVFEERDWLPFLSVQVRANPRR